MEAMQGEGPLVTFTEQNPPGLLCSPSGGLPEAELSSSLAAGGPAPLREKLPWQQSLQGFITVTDAPTIPVCIKEARELAVRAPVH